MRELSMVKRSSTLTPWSAMFVIVTSTTLTLPLDSTRVSPSASVPGPMIVQRPVQNSGRCALRI